MRKLLLTSVCLSDGQIYQQNQVTISSASKQGLCCVLQHLIELNIVSGDLQRLLGYKGLGSTLPVAPPKFEYCCLDQGVPQIGTLLDLAAYDLPVLFNGGLMQINKARAKLID